VLDHAPVTLFSLDKRGVVTLAEGHALAMSGKRSADLVGSSALERYRTRADVVRDLQRALAGEEFSAEHTIDNAVLETHYRPLRDKQGRLAGTVGVSIDITARRRAEEERAKMQAQLLQAQKLESLGVLAGGIAHDFNNLLTSILGNASVALANPSAPSTAERLEDIVLIARRAAELARQMLAYAGRAGSEVRAIDLSRHVREVARLLEASLPKKVRLELDLAAKLPAIEADSAQLQQVIMNLVINGAEAIGDGVGKVRVRTFERAVDAAEGRGLGEAGPETGAIGAGRFVVLEVSDTGAGMDAKTKSRIFDAFFTTKLAGRGLGLATVLGIVRGHGGALRVESAPGKGTSFEVFFPASLRFPSPPSPSEPPPLQGEGLVLIVDDERHVRTAASRILEHYGFRTLTAATGREGVDVFRANA
jgi:PAS domain S-box-containing protein